MEVRLPRPGHVSGDQSPASNWWRPCFIPDQPMWDLWWIKWHGIIPLMAHYTLQLHSPFIRRNDEACQPSNKVKLFRISNEIRKKTYFRVTLQGVWNVYILHFKDETELLDDGSRVHTGSGGNRFWLPFSSCPVQISAGTQTIPTFLVHFLSLSNRMSVQPFKLGH